ncbi:MAG: hypothetical protein ACRETF_00975 [Nevskiaceae bacterium]
MNPIVLWMFAAALSGSALALALAWLAWQRWGRPRYDAELLKVQDVFEQRVRAGVLAAGRELLPALREQVKLGFHDALKESHAAGIAEGTAKIVTGSTDLLVDSLSNLFGLKKK